MSKTNDLDLDAILEDAVNSQQLNQAKVENNDVDTPLKIHIVSDDVKPWLAASANVPKDIREKWTKMVKKDIDTEISTKFQPSYAYRTFDAPIPLKNGINRSLQEIVKRSAVTCELNDQKVAKLLTLVNPVTDSENGKQLQYAFAQQLLQDLSKDIKSDPNFDEKRFASLNSFLVAK